MPPESREVGQSGSAVRLDNSDLSIDPEMMMRAEDLENQGRRSKGSSRGIQRSEARVKGVESSAMFYT